MCFNPVFHNPDICIDDISSILVQHEAFIFHVTIFTLTIVKYGMRQNAKIIKG